MTFQGAPFVVVFLIYEWLLDGQRHLHHDEYRVEENDQSEAKRPLPQSGLIFVNLVLHTRFEAPPAYTLGFRNEVANKQHTGAKEVQSDAEFVGDTSLLCRHDGNDRQQHHPGRRNKLPDGNPRQATASNCVVPNVGVAQLRRVPREKDKDSTDEAEREKNLACRLRRIMHHLAHGGGEVAPGGVEGVPVEVTLSGGPLLDDSDKKRKEETEETGDGACEKQFRGALSDNGLGKRRPLLKLPQSLLQVLDPDRACSW
mmetsp:Transcript_25840/g.73843  ORF Transcript_25840/g.73843 Transcript_25840/m.73843 type:complete len:257 (+) Transcript_25840:398-1168(+)